MTYRVTDRTRAEIWHEYRESMRGAAYYQALHRRFTQRHQTTTWLLIALGSGSVVTATSAIIGAQEFGVWAVVQGVLGLSLAGVSVTVIVGNYALKAAVALTIARECEDASVVWSNLFAAIDTESMEEQEVREARERLSRQLTVATYRSGDVGIVDDAKLNEKATDIANSQLQGIYSDGPDNQAAAAA